MEEGRKEGRKEGRFVLPSRFLQHHGFMCLLGLSRYRLEVMIHCRRIHLQQKNEAKMVVLSVLEGE